MKGRVIRLDAVCCSNVMSNSLKDLAWTAAVGVLGGMMRQQIEADVVCKGALLATLREAWSKALQVLKNGEESTVCCNASLTACATRLLDMGHRDARST